MNDKELILVRHAKSSWKDTTLCDHDRPLNKRGKRNAPEIAIRLAASGVLPEAMFASTALRAVVTAEVFATAFDFSKSEIIREPVLYHADVGGWKAWFEELNDEWDTVFAFGHNPGLTELVADVWGLPITNMPTCGVVFLRFKLKQWKRIADVKPASALFDYPKNATVAFERLL